MALPARRPALSPRERRRRIAVVGGALAVALALDLARPPARQWTARAELAALRLYRATLSAPLGRMGVACRFEPTCSRYAEAAIRADGALRGTLRAVGRVARCGPWTPAGTIDPP